MSTTQGRDGDCNHQAPRIQIWQPQDPRLQLLLHSFHLKAPRHSTVGVITAFTEAEAETQETLSDLAEVTQLVTRKSEHWYPAALSLIQRK